MAEMRAGFWRGKHWLIWIAGSLLAALAIAAVVLSLLLSRAEPFIHARIVETLKDRFHARVELDSFHLSLVNGMWAEGKGLRIWPPAQVEGISVPGPAKPGTEKPNPATPVAGAAGQSKAPFNSSGPQAAGAALPGAASNQPVRPLIQIEEFRFHVPLIYHPGQPFHIALVELKGLVIDLPPKSHFIRTAQNSPTAPGRDSSPSKAIGPNDAIGETAESSSGARLLTFQVDSIECTGARLVLETSNPGKLPLEIAMARFKLWGTALSGIAAAAPMSFEADLTNPRPVGTIHTTGSFGPWLVADPGESSVAGDYRFDHADLATFKGIAGILSSTGHYQGVLRSLTVDGQTETPDFRLTHFGNALSLSTRFHATVDAINGDTLLNPVDATLGHSHFTAQGHIVRAVEAGSNPPRSSGHDIALSINVDRGQIEDFLHLASHSPATLLSGAFTMKAMLHIPPGAAPLHERLQLNGSFALDQARFTSAKIQDRIAELSLRGQGHPQDLKDLKDINKSDPVAILSRMQGDFQLAAGILTLPALDYSVPGAQIQLHGSYRLEGEGLDFTGTAKMQATVSQMVGGWKGMLLKPADRFFKKDGAATEIPIHIEGTREDPKFGIDFDRMKTTSPERPGENLPVR